MLARLFKNFFDSEAAGGLLLLLCTAASLLVANSGGGEGYLRFWHTTLDLSFAGFDLNFSIEQ